MELKLQRETFISGLTMRATEPAGKQHNNWLSRAILLSSRFHSASNERAAANVYSVAYRTVRSSVYLFKRGRLRDANVFPRSAGQNNHRRIFKAETAIRVEFLLSKLKRFPCRAHRLVNSYPGDIYLHYDGCCATVDDSSHIRS